MSINPETKITVKMNTSQGFLSPKTVTIKNQIRQINSIEDLPDVEEITVDSGSTIVYNSTTGKYEVKPLDATFISGRIDGGEF